MDRCRIKPHRKWVKITALACATLLILFTSGVFFGWTSMLLVLKREGVYSNLCTAPATQCEAQDVRFGAIYTTGVVSFLFSPLPAGALLDRIGPRLMLVVCASLLVIALSLLAASHGERFDAYAPAFFVFNFANISAYFSLIHLSQLIPPRQATIISIFSCAFDSSTVVWFLFELVNSGAGDAFSSSTFFATCLVIPVALFLFALLWPEDEEKEKAGEKEERVAAVEAASESASTGAASPPRLRRDASARRRRAGGDGAATAAERRSQFVVTKSKRHVVMRPDARKRAPVASSTAAINNDDDDDDNNNNNNNDDDDATARPSLSPGLVSYRLSRVSLRQQLLSWPFVMLTLYGTVHVFFSNLFLGTAELRLQEATATADDPAAAKDTLARLLGFILPASFVVSPLVGHVLDRYGRVTAFIVVQALAVLFSVLIFLHEPPALILPALVTYSVYRAFFYSAFLALITQIFGFATFGKLYGSMLLIVGSVSLGTYAIIDAVVSAGNDWLVVNIVQLCCLSLSTLFIVYWRKRAAHYQDERPSLTL